MEQLIENVRKSYDQVADEYASHIFHELEHKPLDRELLDRFAQEMSGLGPVCDLGCGPGHVTRYLHERGVEIQGIDLSPRMVEQARALNPGIAFEQGDMTALQAPDGTWAGGVAFYSLIHFFPAQLIAVLRELYRVLQPNGLLLLAFHQGHEVRHLDEWWEKQVSLDFLFFERAEMESYLQQAGFAIEQSIERAPYEAVEVATRRAYIFAWKPL